MCDFKLPPRNI